MINSLHVENFTVFKKADFEFVPGINVLVGGNATGKTHVLKLLYAIQKTQADRSKPRQLWSEGYDVQGIRVHRQIVERVELVDRIAGVFRPEQLQDVIRRTARPLHANVKIDWNGSILRFTLHAEGGRAFTDDDPTVWNDVTQPVYIPPKDVLSLSPGFLSLYRRREVEYDETYPDIIEAAQLDLLRESERNGYAAILEQLTGILQASVEREGDRFYLRDKAGRLSMHMVAEGWRKVALLYQLIANGSIGKDTVLYWDEPESNLNPSLMDEVVDVLLKLSRMGTQIFVATHEYIILKELELQKTDGDTLRMFALERGKKDGSVSVHPAESYIELKPNLIAEQFDRIYDMTVQRAIGARNGN